MCVPQTAPYAIRSVCAALRQLYIVQIALQISFPFQIVVPLLEEGREQRGGFHIQVEEIDGEGDHEEPQRRQQQNQGDFQKLFQDVVSPFD